MSECKREREGGGGGRISAITVQKEKQCESSVQRATHCIILWVRMRLEQTRERCKGTWIVELEWRRVKRRRWVKQRYRPHQSNNEHVWINDYCQLMCT